ncbi:MAG: hypothetical protein ACOZBL_02820 [Patescibacteria group bacterium]
MKIMLNKVKMLMLSIFVATVFNFSFAAVPSEYYPNYKIQASWDQIVEHMVKIEAYKQT